MQKIFISYSRKDIDFVRKLAGDLEQAGYDVWWDIADLRGGADWVREIPKAIKSSRYVIVVLTPTSNESEWVKKEIAEALSLRKRIIPIILLPCSVPFELKTINPINFSVSEYTDNLGKLLSSFGNTGKLSIPSHQVTDIEKRLSDIRQRLLQWRKPNELLQLKWEVEKIIAVFPKKDQPIDAVILLEEIDRQISAQKKRSQLSKWPTVVTAFVCVLFGMGLLLLRDYWLPTILSGSPPTFIAISTITPTLFSTNTPIMFPTPTLVPNEIIVTFSDDSTTSYKCSTSPETAILNLGEKIRLEFSAAMTEDDLSKLEWWTFISGSKEKVGVGETAFYSLTNEGGIIYVMIGDVIICTLNIQTP